MKLNQDLVKVWSRFGSAYDKNSPTIKVVLNIQETNDPKEVFEAVSILSGLKLLLSTWYSTRDSNGTKESHPIGRFQDQTSTPKSFTWLTSLL